MRYNRRLMPFKAISFDLDDTLYHNAPVMLLTDAKMQQYFDQHLPAGNYDYHFWQTFRLQALHKAPLLRHDVGEWRRQSYYLGAKTLGFHEEEATRFAERAMAYFIRERSNFVVPEKVHQLLSILAKKWPLIAISNGNVDTKQINIAQYFTAIYHADIDNKQKPDADMFAKACQQLNIKPKELLHVGDCGVNDILGAARYGCQTAWVSTYDVGKPISQLPTLELRDVLALNRLAN